ncbi:MAG: biopolymer transporter ExbD [Rubrivivax sp.]
MAFASFDAKRTPMPMSEINMVPLIDVMLVLLVIFIVTAPLLTHAVKLELPKASAEVNQLKPDKIELAIDAQGQRYFNGERLSRQQIAERFTQAGKIRPLPELHLRADEAVSYRVVAETLADASRAGLGRIGFVSAPEAR